MGTPGVPLRANPAGIAPIAHWWSQVAHESPGLRLRSDFVRPYPGLSPSAPWAYQRTGMKDLLRSRGVAAHLFIAALYLEQLRRPSRARNWIAQPLDESRHLWRDDSPRGELRSPSWSSLVLGYEERPRDPQRFKQWHTTRYRAITAGFKRLEATELINGVDRVLQCEDRRWRWNPRVVDKVYRSVDTRNEKSFVVPSTVFTSGLYLKLSGPGLYTLLVALQFRPTSSDALFHLRGLTWKTFDKGYPEVKESTKDPKVLEPLAEIHRRRYFQELNSIGRRLDDPDAPIPTTARLRVILDALGLDSITLGAATNDDADSPSSR